jgi:hypothetical protein
LPSEPCGYSGFKTVFGNVNVAPVICSAALSKQLSSVGRDSRAIANRSILGDDAGYTKFLATIAGIMRKRDASRRDQAAAGRGCFRQSADL